MTAEQHEALLNPGLPVVPGVLLRFGAERTVHDMWARMLTYRRCVAEIYRSGGGPEGLPLHYLIDDTLGQIWHFAEAFPAGEVRTAAITYRRRTDSALILAGAVANTSKHSGRDKEKQAGGGYFMPLDGRKRAVTLRWEGTPSDPVLSERDALEFIDACLVEWWSFLEQRADSVASDLQAPPR
jgi:hypothetical protein